VTAFWTALFYVFIAEIGDKTQLMTVAFTARHKPLLVLSAVAVATAVINLISVGLGAVVGNVLSLFWINLLAGVAFIIFGIMELKSEDEDNAKENSSKFGPFFTVMFSFFFAELGDKTMLAAFAIASKEQQFWQVWAGSTVGLVGSNALAVVAGSYLRKSLSARKLKIAIAVVYILSGALAIYEATKHHTAN
jgi:putative Ca2+/H+ antiporter (TMEM165/GDT1 family)